MVYECARRKELSANYDVPELTMVTEWEDIDSDLVENMVSVATLINTICGNPYTKQAHTEYMKKELEEGRAIVLTNFYVRVKQAH